MLNHVESPALHVITGDDANETKRRGCVTIQLKTSVECIEVEAKFTLSPFLRHEIISPVSE